MTQKQPKLVKKVSQSFIAKERQPSRSKDRGNSGSRSQRGSIKPDLKINLVMGQICEEKDQDSEI